MVARYVKGQCVYADGSPAEVSNGDSPDEIPENYLKFCQNDEDQALRMWEATKEWRIKSNIWKIHTTPNTWYSAIKRCYPHYCHGYSKCGCTVVYESAGKLNLKELFQGECQTDDVLHHYVYFMEWLSNKLSASEELRRVRCPDGEPSHNSSTWGLMSVVDVQGATISSVWSMDVMNYLRRACAINSDHYPLTMKRVFIVNSPYWVSGVFQTLQPIIPDSVQIEILSTDYMDVLRKYIDDEQIPKEFGGSSAFPLGQHPFEVDFDELVQNAAGNPNDSMEGTQATVLSTESGGELEDLKELNELDDGKEFHTADSFLASEEAVFLVEDEDIFYEALTDPVSATQPSEQS